MPKTAILTPAHPFVWSHGSRSVRFALLRPVSVEIEYEVDASANRVRVTSFEAAPSPAASVGLQVLKRTPRPVTFEYPRRRGAVGERVVTGETLELSDVSLPLAVRIGRRYTICRTRSRATGRGLRFPRFYLQSRVALRYKWTLTQSSVVFNNRGEPVPQSPKTLVSKRVAVDAPPWSVRHTRQLEDDGEIRCEPVPRNTPSNRLVEVEVIERDLRAGN